jgi:DNA-binding MarR family transcriptional regulator
MSSISKGLGVSLSAMTQIADRLERDELVHRVADDSDRRIRSLQLTERGENIMRRREECRVQAVEAAMKRLTPPSRREIQSALEMLLQAGAAVNGKKSIKPILPAALVAGGDNGSSQKVNS